jgi:hypothetical protein
MQNNITTRIIAGKNVSEMQEESRLVLASPSLLDGVSLIL